MLVSLLHGLKALEEPHHELLELMIDGARYFVGTDFHHGLTVFDTCIGTSLVNPIMDIDEMLVLSESISHSQLQNSHNGISSIAFI